jgi:hypothetical protein
MCHALVLLCHGRRGTRSREAEFSFGTGGTYGTSWYIVHSRILVLFVQIPTQ